GAEQREQLALGHLERNVLRGFHHSSVVARVFGVQRLHLEHGGSLWIKFRSVGTNLSSVMPGLGPGIHVLQSTSKSWMAGTGPAMTPDRAVRNDMLQLSDIPNLLPRSWAIITRQNSKMISMTPSAE